MESKPKYNIGDELKIANWGGETKPLKILDIQKTFHRRIGDYCWGYKMDGETGLTMEYVPEGYLRPTVQ